MKRVISISLGSKERDHKVEVELLGEKFEIERRGTNGDLNAVISLVKELDGKVDAFGMGGIDFYIRTKKNFYYFPDAKKISAAARKTPMLDGSKLKNILEHRVITYLDRELNMLKGKKVLMVSAVDRFGMANGFEEVRCETAYGDLAFGLGVPFLVKTRAGLERLASILTPIVVRLPYKLIYPTGEKQDTITPKFPQFYKEADVIAGDFHMVRKYMPDDMSGKIIITNTTTAKNVEELRSRGVEVLVTSTPNLEGRSFGCNVLEAVLVTLSGRRPEDLEGEDYMEILKSIGYKPRVQYLQK